MIQYRNVLEMAHDGLSLRTVYASTGHGRPKVIEILQLAKDKGLECPLTEETNNHWIEKFLYPYKAIENSGYGMIDYELVHRELAKPNVTLSLFQYELSFKWQNSLYLSVFSRHYKAYVDKDKATLRLSSDLYRSLILFRILSIFLSECLIGIGYFTAIASPLLILNMKELKRHILLFKLFMDDFPIWWEVSFFNSLLLWKEKSFKPLIRMDFTQINETQTFGFFDDVGNGISRIPNTRTDCSVSAK